MKLFNRRYQSSLTPLMWILSTLVFGMAALALVVGLAGPAQAVTVCKSGCQETSIREAASNNDYIGQDIFVRPGIYNEGEIWIQNRSLIATDNNPATTIIDATGIVELGSRPADVLHVDSATIRGFTLRGGVAGVRTLGMQFYDTKIVLENLIIEDNKASGYWLGTATESGGVIVKWGSLEIINNTIQNNQNNGSTPGGGIYFDSTSSPTVSLTISGGTKITGNVGQGIGIRSIGQITIRDTTVDNNSTGIVMLNPPGAATAATVLIEDSVIQNSTSGGGMSVRDNVTLNNVDILNNIEQGHGGGIYLADDGVLTINGGRIEGNQAGWRGGGIYLYGLSSQLSSSAIITNNTALEDIAGTSGGGIYCQNDNDVAIVANSVFNNTPDDISCVTTERPPDLVVAASTANSRNAATDQDPVNTFTGELFSQKPRELNLGGPMPLYFQRYYAAYLRRGNILGDLGSNWRHNFDARVNWSGNTLTYTTHDGRETDFLMDIGTGVWSQLTNTDTPYQLSAVGGNDVTLYDTEIDRIYTFDFTTSSTIIGKLAKIEDGKGNAHTITYDLTNAQIQTVSDGLGRTLTFTYNADTIPKISVVYDGTRSISFQYTDAIDTEYLTLSTNARTGMTTYTYGDTSANADHALMRYMTRPRGNTPYIQTFYDTTTLASGKVETQTDANGNTYSFDYNDLDTTITGPLGNTRVHTHTETGEFANREDETGLSFSMGSDSTGRRNSLTDRLGNTTSVNYDAPSGNLANVTNPDGTTSSFNYTARLFGALSLYDLTTITHADGTIETFVYDANGNPTSHTDRAGNITSATFNSYGQALTSTNVAGGISTNTYNADATMATTSDPAANTTTLGYDALRRVNLLTFADANTRSMTRDNADNLLTTTDENGNTATMAYDANNNLAMVQDALLNTSTLTYDGNDRLLDITDPLGGTTSQTFNSIGKLAGSIDANGNATTYGYNTLGRRTTLTDPGGNTWTTTYDVEAIITSSTDPLLNTTTFTSDAMGRITQNNSPLGNTSGVTYDAMGRVIATVDALYNTTTMTRDARGLLSSVSLPGGISASYSRNALGEIIAITDPNGNSWNRAYDNMGRETSSTDPLTNSQTITYDNRNRPDTITFPGALGNLTLAYDPAGNLSSRSYSDGTSLNFTYDENDRLIVANGITQSFDANGRVTDSNGIAIVRDAGGRITQMTLAAGKSVSYTYDANDRIIEVSDWAGGVSTFSYDAAGRLTGMTRPSGVNASRSYDNDSRLTDLSEGAISTINLTRNAKGQITNATRSVPLAASAAGLPSVNNSVDAASQLTSATYDAMGRTTSEGSNSFVWNLASQLTSFTTASGTTTASYDAAGNRLSRIAGGVTRSYTWNHALGLPSISIEQQGGSDLRYYVHTPGGALLYSVDANTDTRSFYHYDETGNTIFVTDDAGNVAASYAYTPYGQLLAKTGELDNPFTWQGQYGVMDEGDGFYYIRARYYDANTMRFISRDPVKSIDPMEINPYQYARGDPLKFVDVDGRQSLSISEREDLRRLYYRIKWELRQADEYKYSFKYLSQQREIAEIVSSKLRRDSLVIANILDKDLDDGGIRLDWWRSGIVLRKFLTFYPGSDDLKKNKAKGREALFDRWNSVNQNTEAIKKQMEMLNNARENLAEALWKKLQGEGNIMEIYELSEEVRRAEDAFYDVGGEE